MSQRTLILPEYTPGHGSGHLIRAARLAVRLAEAQIVLDPVFATPARATTAVIDRALSLLARHAPGVPVVSTPTEYRSDDRVVIDMPRPPERFIRRVCGAAVVVGIDTGGPARKLVPFLIDSLPRTECHQANIATPRLLDLPAATDVAPESGHVVVAFGGEDAARLTERVARSLSRFDAAQRTVKRITVVRPSLRQLEAIPGNCTIAEPSDQFWQLLATAETCVCQFGLTAFEALALDCRVITVAPSRYHHRLATAAGLPRWNGRSWRGWRRAVRAARDERPSPWGTSSEPSDLAGLIDELNTPDLRGCPLHQRDGRIVCRTADRSYYRCRSTGLVYMKRYRGQEIEYNTDYFDREYEKQYGRTYLQDFDTIKSVGVRRAATIAARTRGRILDVGCAYGPFLAAAAEQGFEPYGIDIAEDPVRHVNEALGFRAHVADVLDFEPRATFGIDCFDAVALWYVIEHIAQLDQLLRKLGDWIRPGGVLAFSTPNGSGVSARRRTERFFRESPSDHLTIWSPRTARVVLEQYGFRSYQTTVTGHHPERYPAVQAGRIPVGVADWHSRVFGWGDTFEMYFQRQPRSVQ